MVACIRMHDAIDAIDALKAWHEWYDEGFHKQNIIILKFTMNIIRK
jgi:hypothetical protein